MGLFGNLLEKKERCACGGEVGLLDDPSMSWGEFRAIFAAMGATPSAVGAMAVPMQGRGQR